MGAADFIVRQPPTLMKVTPAHMCKAEVMLLSFMCIGSIPVCLRTSSLSDLPSVHRERKKTLHVGFD